MANKKYLKFKNFLDVGLKFMEDIWKEADLCDRLLECPPEQDKIKVRILKRIATMFTDKIFPRDPEVTAKPKRPMPGPIQIDPTTGMPAVDPATGEFAPPEDLGEKRAEVVELVMNEELKSRGLASECRAAIHDSFIRPGAAIQVGYDYNEETDTDGLYIRRRSIKDLIIDPHSEMYYGQLHNCRFVGIRMKLTKEDCKRRGIDVKKVPQEDQAEENSALFMTNEQRQDLENGEDYHKELIRYKVWQMWDETEKELAYLSEKAEELVSPVIKWPWKIVGFPVKFLSSDRLPDKTFGHSPVYDLQDQQLEFNDLRTTMHDNVVDAKPFNVYDPLLLKEDQISGIANRRKDLYVGVEGLAGKMLDQFFRRVNPDGLAPEMFPLYNLIKNEVFEVGGASSNDRQEETHSTATEAEIIRQAGQLITGARSITTINFIRQIIQCSHQIIEQTYTTERVTAITSPEQGMLWVQWNGPDLLGDFNIDLDLITAKPNDPETEKREAVELKNLLADIPGSDLFTIGMDIVKAYQKKNPSRYLRPVQQLPPELAAAMMTGGKPPTRGKP